MANGIPKKRRAEFEEVASVVKKGSKVIDLGCGNGELLKYLKEKLGIRETGVEISPVQINSCVSKGVSVLQSDLDAGLRYPRKSFDTVLIVDTLQTTPRPIRVLENAIRVGRQVVLVFPNFAHFAMRSYLFLRGKMPKNRELPYEWFDTPNIHLFTIKDFIELCGQRGIKITKKAYFDSAGRKVPDFAPNFFAAKALFVLKK
jgi:methionine biosynthesis protein MetW